MNVSKFSFCLSHEDPDVVLRGLESFTGQVLKEQDAIESFGYYGRSTTPREASSLGRSTNSVRGLLASYLTASSSCEELFSLWGVPGRDDDIELCVAHMHCFAAILHCSASSHLRLVDNIVSRIIHEVGRSIQQQLNSSSVPLIHSTMGLLITMMASSQQNCRNVYQKFLGFNMGVLGNASQKGKAVVWKQPNSSQDNANADVDDDNTSASNHSNIRTCGRHLTAIILHLMVLSEEAEMVHELLSVTSLLRKLSNSIARTSTDTAVAIIRMLSAFVDSPAVVGMLWDSRNALVDPGLQDTLLGLLETTEEEGEGGNNVSNSSAVSASTHELLLKYCKVLAAGMEKQKAKGMGYSPARNAALQLIKGLRSSRNLAHRALESVLLRANSGLLSKVLGTMTGPWDVQLQCTFKFVATMSHLSSLMNDVDTGNTHTLRASLRSLASAFSHQHQVGAAGEKSSSSSSRADLVKRLEELVDDIMRGIVPPSLSKSALTKIVQAKNALAQRMGLVYCIRALQRIRRLSKLPAGASAEFASAFEGCLSKALHRCFPDFQGVITVRTKLVKELLSYSAAAATSGSGSGKGNSPEPDTKRRRTGSKSVEEEPVEEDEDEDEEEGGGSKETAQERSLYLLGLAGELLGLFMQVGPSSTLYSNFDFTRLMDEAFTWSQAESATDVSTRLAPIVNTTTEGRGTMLLQTLKILRHATQLRLCRWFGSAEDASKTITNLLVSIDWQSSVKRSALSKLILLSSLRGSRSNTEEDGDIDTDTNSNSNVSAMAREVLLLALNHSSLFLGHGHVDFELSNELHAWIASLAADPSNAVPALDVLVKFAYHWSYPLSTGAAAGVALAGRQTPKPPAKKKGKKAITDANTDAGADTAGALLSEVAKRFQLDESAVDEKAPWYLHAIGETATPAAADKDGDNAAASPSYNGHCLPLSPVMLAGLALACGDLSCVAESLPTHVRDRLHTLSSFAAAPASGAATGSDAAAFFSKFVDGFAGVARGYLGRVLLECTQSARSGASYCVLAHVLAVQSESRGAGMLATRSADAGTMSDTVAALERKASAGDLNQRLSNLIVLSADGEANSSGKGSGSSASDDFQSYDFSKSLGGEEVFQRHFLWLVVHYFKGGVHTRSPSPSFLCLVATELQSRGVRATADTTTAAAALLGQILEVVYYASSHASVAGNYTKKAAAAAAAVSKELSALLGTCHAVATSLLSCSAFGAAPEVLSVFKAKLELYENWLPTAIESSSSTSSSSFGGHVRVLLCCAAAVYLRKVSFRAGNIHPLWQHVMRRYAAALSTESGGDAAVVAAMLQQADMIALGWLLERVSSFDVDCDAAVSQAGRLLVAEAGLRGEDDNVSVLLRLGLRSTSSATTAVANNTSTSNSTALVVPTSTLHQTQRSVLMTAGPGVLLRSVIALATSPERKEDEDGGEEGNALLCLAMDVVASSSAEQLLSLQSFCDPVALGDPASEAMLPAFLDSLSSNSKGNNKAASSTVEGALLASLPAARLARLSAAMQQYYGGERNRLPAGKKAADLTSLRRVLHLASLSQLPSSIDLNMCFDSIASLQQCAEELRKCVLSAEDDSSLLSLGSAEELTGGLLRGCFPVSAAADNSAISALGGLLNSSTVLLSAPTLRPLLASLVQARTASGGWASGDEELLPRINFTLLALCVASTQGGQSSQLDDCAGAWKCSYLECLDAVCDAAVKGLRAGAADGGSKRHLLAYVVDLLVAFPTVKTSSNVGNNDDNTEFAERARAALNKFCKGCLRHGLHDEAALRAVARVSSTLSPSSIDDNDDSGSSSRMLLLVSSGLCARETDFFHPGMLLRMLVSHSRYASTLDEPSSQASLLRFVLVLVSALDGTETQAQQSQGNLTSAEVKALSASLLRLYKGTLCDRDRTILRSLHLLHEKFSDSAPALAALQLGEGPASTQPRSYSPEWLFTHLLPGGMYTTLGDFPLWRGFHPQPLPVEGGRAVADHCVSTGVSQDAAYKRWATADSDQQQMSVVDMEEGEGGGDDGERGSDAGSDSDNSDSDEDDDSQDGEQDGEVEGQHEQDEGKVPILDLASVPDSCTICDPSFWLPVIHTSLNSGSVPVRQLANSGALSLIVASLSSACPLLRAYALSCLTKVQVLLAEQTPAKYPNFRERPQMLTFVNFIRNALTSMQQQQDEGEEEAAASKKKASPLYRDGTPCPCFPPTLGVFLGRSALHIMQPAHELYTPVNKYILSRPFCDAKDVPLFDLLVFGGDSQKEVQIHEKLAALRLIRDGLATRIDHLNMCRKHAYPRLMGLLTLPGTDVRVSHAVFDILEKGLTMRAASRYIIERCGIIAWLVQVGSPLSSLGIALSRATLSGSSNDGDGDNSAAAVAAKVDDGLLSIPARLLTRALTIMRLVVAASYLLAIGDGASLPLPELRSLLSLVVDHVLLAAKQGNASTIPRDYYRQLVLLLWDVALVSAALGDSSASRAWAPSVVSALTEAVSQSFAPNTNYQQSHNHNHYHQQQQQPHAFKERDELLASLVSLLAFSGQNDSQSAYGKNSDGATSALRLLDVTVGVSISRGGSGVQQQSGGKSAVSHVVMNRAAPPAVISSSGTSSSNDSRPYYCAVHLAAIGDPHSASKWHHPDHQQESFITISSAWEQLKRTDMGAMSLPCATSSELSACTRLALLLKPVQASLLQVATTTAAGGGEGSLGLGLSSPSRASIKSLTRWTLCLHGSRSALVAEEARQAPSSFARRAAILTTQLSSSSSQAAAAAASAAAPSGVCMHMASTVRNAICCACSYLMTTASSSSGRADACGAIYKALATILGFPVATSLSPSWLLLRGALQEQSTQARITALWASAQQSAKLLSVVLALCNATADAVSFLVSDDDRSSSGSNGQGQGGQNELPESLKDTLEDLAAEVAECAAAQGVPVQAIWTPAGAILSTGGGGLFTSTGSTVKMRATRTNITVLRRSKNETDVDDDDGNNDQAVPMNIEVL